MHQLPPTISNVDELWYALLLIVAVSLVYAATRHELFRPILYHAVRVGIWIVGFMLAIFIVLLLMDWWVTDRLPDS